jgi:arylformamidase
MSDWIDCTQPLDEAVPVWPGDPPFRRTLVSDIARGDVANSSILSCSAHVGTHIDAPRHLFADGDPIDALTPGRLCGPAHVVQTRKPRDVGPDDFSGVDIRPGDGVLFKTCNADCWSAGGFQRGFHAVSVDAAHRLVALGVGLVGVDVLSVDRYGAEDLPVHRVLLGAGVVIVEGLRLERVAPGGYELVALPMLLAGSDGAPARVLLRPVS